MGKQKLVHKTVVISILPPQNFQGLTGVDFSLREILAHFSFVFLLHCFDCTQTHSIVAYLIRQGEPVINWTFLLEKNMFWAKKLHRRGFFWGFHTLLDENASQFCFAAPMMLKHTG